MNGFIDWNFSRLLISKRDLSMMKIEMAKINIFDSLYLNEFIKLNIKHVLMLKSKDAFQLQLISKIKFFALIKQILEIKIKHFNNSKKIQHNEIIIHEHNNEQVKNIDDIDINNTIYLHESIVHYYQKKDDVTFVLINEQNFVSPGFWKRVQEHITSSTSLPNNGCKYNICQVKKIMNHRNILMLKHQRFFCKRI